MAVSRPSEGSEREMLQRFLVFARDALARKVEGVGCDAASRKLVPSQTTLLGLLKHSTDTQEHWFRNMMLGESVPLTYYCEDDEDADWRIEPDDTVEAVIASFRAACRRADRAVADVPLDTPAAKRPDHTLRWIYLDMIYEISRHAGHADILRELTDGTGGE